MKISAKNIKNIKRDKSGNTVVYPKAGKPQVGAALTAGTYPQLNVSSDGQITSHAACSGGQSPCLHAWDSGHGVCWLAKASQSGHFTGQHPNSTAVPRVSALLPCAWVQLCTVKSCSKHPYFGSPLQGCTWGHLGPLLSPPFAPSPGSHPCRFPTTPALLGFLQNASLGHSQISQGSCISEISLPVQCPFPGGIHMGHFWGQWQIHHTTGFPAVPPWGQFSNRGLFGTGSLPKQWVTVLQTEGTASDT